MGTNYCTIEHPQWNRESVCLICNEWHPLLLNNENISRPLESFSCSRKWYVLSFHPWFWKQSPQNNETSNSKISPFVVMYMAYRTFLGLKYQIHTLSFGNQTLLGSSLSPAQVITVLNSLKYLKNSILLTVVVQWSWIEQESWIENHFPWGS